MFALVSENLTLMHYKNNFADDAFNATDENETNIEQVDNNKNNEDDNAMTNEHLNMIKSNNNMNKIKEEIIFFLQSIKIKAPPDNTNELCSHGKELDNTTTALIYLEG